MSQEAAASGTTGPTCVTFTPTLDDMLAAFATATRLPPWRIVLAGLLFGPPFGAAGYLLQSTPGYDWPGAIFGTLAFPVAFVWLMRRKVRHDVAKAFATQPALSERRTVCWDPAGLSWSTSRENSSMPWTAFTRSQHTPHSLLLWRNRKRFDVLPLRVLTPEHLATLQPFLAALGGNRPEPRHGPA